MLPGFCRDDLTIVRAPVPSAGRRERDWSSATSTTVGGCSVQVSTSSGEQSDRYSTSETLEAYLPPTADVRSTDRVVVGGTTYTVDGEPQAFRSPFGSLDCVRVTLKRWIG